MRALDLRAPVLLGHSMGASTSLLAAARQPEVPRAIVREDPPPSWGWGDRPAEDERARVAEMRARFRAMKRTGAELAAEQRQEAPTWPEAEIARWVDAKQRFDLAAGAYVDAASVTTGARPTSRPSGASWRRSTDRSGPVRRRASGDRQPALQQRVVGDVDAGHEVARVEGDLLGLREEVAASVSKATIDSYRHRGSLPTPQVVRGRTPLWARPIISHWLATRPGPGWRSDLYRAEDQVLWTSNDAWA